MVQYIFWNKCGHFLLSSEKKSLCEVLCSTIPAKHIHSQSLVVDKAVKPLESALVNIRWGPYMPQTATLMRFRLLLLGTGSSLTMKKGSKSPKGLQVSFICQALTHESWMNIDLIYPQLISRANFFASAYPADRLINKERGNLQYNFVFGRCADMFVWCEDKMIYKKHDAQHSLWQLDLLGHNIGKVNKLMK